MIQSNIPVYRPGVDLADFFRMVLNFSRRILDTTRTEGLPLLSVKIKFNFEEINHIKHCVLTV